MIKHEVDLGNDLPFNLLYVFEGALITNNRNRFNFNWFYVKSIDYKNNTCVLVDFNSWKKEVVKIRDKEIKIINLDYDNYEFERIYGWDFGEF